MSKMHGATIWVLAAALLSAIARPGTHAAGARSAAAVEPRTAPGPSPREHQSAPSDDDIDTLEVIGQSLAVDVSAEGLQRRAISSVERLHRDPGDNTAALENAVWFLHEFARLPIRPHSELEKATADLDALNPKSPDPARLSVAAASADAFVTRYFDRYALTDKNASKEDVLLARDFDEIDKSPLQLAVLRNVTERRGIHVRFLIATLPDPIDSYTGWQFDPMLDAITQAVAESDYVLDRFHFPDSDKEDGHQSAGARGSRHELEPGVVVFKKHVDTDTEFAKAGAKDGATPFGDRLVLLVVHENPAAGIHWRAMANTIGLVIKSRHLMPGDEFEKEIAILGPTFSGSSETLNRALVAAGGRNSGACRQTKPSGKCRVRIVSGSATDRQNKNTIEYGFGTADRPLDVTFHATVNPDDVLLPNLVKKIREAGWSRRAALLHEANTQYGRALRETVKDESFVQLPFPMNVSRLRATLESQDPARPAILGLPSRFRPVPMESEGSPLDQIPLFHPKSAATYVELALAGTLDTLRREHVRTVGLMATDPRDKLFLAQQIARYSPDVSLFTAESDSVYVHPDYSPYLRGALVASTYPLYGANQRWSYAYQGDAQRRQFANSSAQGIYNAALALLDYDENGSPAPDAPGLLEYGMPGQPCPESGCTPPVWISVIGRLGAWPVRALPASQADAGGYVFAVQPRGGDGAGRLTVFPPPLFHALLILVTCAILVAWALQGMSPANRPDSWLRIDRVEPARRGYLLVCLAGVLLVHTFVWVICLVRMRVERASGSSVTAFAIASLGVLAGGHMMARVAAAAIRADGNVLRRVLKWSVARIAAVVAVAVGCAWSVVSLAIYLSDQATQPWGDDISFVSRAFDLRNGVSPTVPVLFLASAVTFWGLVELWRVRLGRAAVTDPDVHPLLQKAIYGDAKTIASSLSSLNRSMLSVPTSGLVIAAFALLASITFAFDPVRPLVSIEGAIFGRFVSATLLFVQITLMLALIHLALLWSRLRRLLGFMAHHEFADAYDRVPRDVFPIMLFPRPPRLADLKIPVALCAGRAGEASAADAYAVGVREEASDLEKLFRREMRETPHRRWTASETWRALLEGALQTEPGLGVDRLLGSNARMRLAQLTPSSPGDDFVAKAVSEIVAADRALYQREAELPAILIAFVVRDALSRLAPSLIFVVGAVMLAFCSHTLFPFQQHTGLQALAWVYIGVTFTTILTVLVQIKRNDIVGRLTSLEPGRRTTWDGAFVLKVAVFALLPLLTLFAAQFPDIGGVLLRWLEPVEHILP